MEACSRMAVDDRHGQRWIDWDLGSQSRPAERCDRAIELLLLTLLAFGPLAFGVVHAWSEQIVIALATAVALLFCFKRFLFRTTPLGWTWTYIPVALFILLVVFQLLPLPPAFISAISPNTAALKTELLADVPGAAQTPSAMSLTFYQHATRHDLRLLLAVAAVFVVVVNVYRDPARIKRLLAGVALIGGTIALLALGQDIAGNGKIYWLVPTHDGAYSGTFINHSHYGQFMNMSIGAALALLLVCLHEAFADEKAAPARVLEYLRSPQARHVKWLIAAIVLGAATVFVSLTRGGMLAMLIAAAFTVLVLGSRQSLRGRGWIIVLVALAAFTCILWIGFDEVYDRLASLCDVDAAAGGRWQMIEQTARAWTKFPAFGTGLGTYEVVYPMFDRGASAALATHAENEYVQLLAETGGAGFAALLVLGILIWLSYVRTVRGGSAPIHSAVYGLGFGLMAILFHSLSDFGQHMPANAMLTAVTCGLLVALARLGRANRQPVVISPAGVAQRLGRLLVLVAAAGGFAWALLAANSARVAEAHWKQAEATAYYLEAEQWVGSEQAHKHLFEHAQAATTAEPGNIQYHHWLGIYRWLSLSPYVDPNTDQLHAQALPWARQLVDDLHRARGLCPTFGVLCCLAGEIEMFALADPNGAAHIRQGYRLAPCNGPVCMVAARADAAAGDAEQAYAKLARAVLLDGATFSEAAALCIDDLARPDLALELADRSTGRLSQVANLLAASDQHTELAEQARAQVYERLAQRAEQPDAPASVHSAMARHDAERGEVDAAIERYRLALRKDYDQVGWHYELACLLARVGRVAEAMHEARICLRLRQDYAPARRLLEELAVRPPEPSVAAGS